MLPTLIFIWALTVANNCVDDLTDPIDETQIFTVELSPSTVTLESGENQEFEVVARDEAGAVLASADITWAATGGTISGSGVFTAGDEPGTYHVIASVTGTSLEDTATITIVPVGSGALVSGITPSSYRTGTLEAGTTYYIDRGFVVNSVPSEYQGWLLIKTANDDKNATAAEFLCFDLSQGATVAVAYDGRATSLPAWLSDWTNTSSSLATSDQASPMPIRARVFEPGQVCLGGNMSDGAAGARSNYVVFVDARDGGETPVLTQLLVEPSSATLSPGASRQFEASGRDQFGDPFEVSASWSATGGSINSSGFYTAGGETGSFHVTARAADLEATAAVTIRQESQGSAEVWRRSVISLADTSYSGNPFELEVDATFTHGGSGETITLPGYYAGDDTWKIGFMPTRPGDWSYVTSSSDSDLSGHTGSLSAVSSGNRGLLQADATHPRKWKFSDGSYLAVPVMLRIDFFYESATEAAFAAAADFMAANNIHMMDTRLQDASSSMLVFEGDWQNHRFNLALWDQLERRMEALTERGLGAYIMPYTDDAGAPRWSGQSDTEALLLRYMVARLAGFPVLLWDTGIDIQEYRSSADIDWFGDRVRDLDPYGHPISSRRGGGSGNIAMSGRTYDSRGDRLAIVQDMINYYESANIPVAMTDAWGENRPSHPEKNFRPADVRRSMWKALVSGGLGVIYRGSDGYFHISSLASDLESEQWIRLVNPFVESKLGETFGEMQPSASLVENGYCLADPARTKLLFFVMGKNDKWDPEAGGDVTLKLSGVSGTYQATWFDTRDGSESSAGTLSGGSDHIITPPSTDDWVLLLTRSSP